MDGLPSELINHICSFLPVPSLKAFRLTCKEYAAIGEVHLFHDFEFCLLPNSHRLYHLERLAENTAISSKLRCISFKSGVPLEYADYRYWQAQVYQDISSAWSQNLLVKGGSRQAYEEFHAGLQARFTSDLSSRYELYWWHMDKEMTMFADHRTRNKILRNLNNISESNKSFTLKLIMDEPRVTLANLEAFNPTEHINESIRDIEPRKRIAKRRENCLEHFLQFLEAANLSKCRVRVFKAVDMPRQLLTVDRLHGSDVLDALYRDLTHVEMKISQLPHSEWLARSGTNEVYFGGRNLAARRLARLLLRPKEMESLSLEFPKGKEAEWSFDLFDQTNLDMFPRPWLSCLKSLSLCRFQCSWADLEALLKAAKNTKSLTLGYCRLETGSMLDFLYFLPSMSLKDISLDGTWYIDEDAGEWHSHKSDNFTDCFAATSYEGPYAKKGMRSKLERFVLEGGDCPLPKWTRHGREEVLWELLGDTSFHYLPGPSQYG